MQLTIHQRIQFLQSFFRFFGYFSEFVVDDLLHGCIPCLNLLTAVVEGFVQVAKFFLSFAFCLFYIIICLAQPFIRISQQTHVLV